MSLLAALPPPGTFEGEAVRALLVAPLFLLLFAAAETWRRVANPPVEWTRKAVHTGGGIVAAGFPWIFTSHWTVLALGAAFALILWGTRRLGLLQSVHGVTRRSEGGLYYPLAIYLLFRIASPTPVFYLISILALVVSDTVAALVGTTYGRITYSVEAEDRRSLEGSAVFFLATFLGVHLPLLLLSGTGRAESVVIAVQVALIVTFFEAVCLYGSDNLVVPLVTYFLLVKMTPRPAEFLAAQLAAQLVLIGVISWAAIRSRVLTVSGAIGATLFFYGAFALGGPEWIVAPALALAGVVSFFLPTARRGVPTPRGDYQVAGVFYSTIVAAALVALNNAWETLLPVGPALARADPLYPAFLGVLAAHLAMLAMSWREPAPEAVRPLRRLAALGIGLAWTVPAGITVWRGDRLEGALVATGTCLVAFSLYAALRWWRRMPRGPVWELRLEMAASLAALAVVLPAHFLWLARG